MKRILIGFLTLVVSPASCGGSVDTGGKSDSGSGGGGSGGAFGAGGSAGSGVIAPADVYLTSSIGPSSKSQPCQIGTVTRQLQIGSVTIGVPTGTEGTTVVCSVTPSGSGFAVSAEVEADKGSFAVSGTMPSSGTAKGISASLDYEAAGVPVLYSAMNCEVTLANASTPGYDPSTGPPIAPGRVWGTVNCPDMTVMGQAGHVCDGVITFRLENCAGSP